MEGKGRYHRSQVLVEVPTRRGRDPFDGRTTPPRVLDPDVNLKGPCNVPTYYESAGSGVEVYSS